MKMAGWWRQRREELSLQQQESSTGPPFYIPSPVEGRETKEDIDERVARAKHCTDGKLSFTLFAELTPNLASRGNWIDRVSFYNCKSIGSLLCWTQVYSICPCVCTLLVLGI